MAWPWLVRLEAGQQGYRLQSLGRISLRQRASARSDENSLASAGHAVLKGSRKSTISGVDMGKRVKLVLEYIQYTIYNLRIYSSFYNDN